MADEELKAWLRQARAGWRAGQAAGTAACHRRYWLQQACEKGIKALGLILWHGHEHEAGQFRNSFLNRHSPIGFLSTEIARDPALPRSLKLLLREVKTEFQKLDGSRLLERVESTTASLNPAEVSYRYPFLDSSGNLVAPVDWTEADWDAYQGNAAGVIAAIERFLNALENLRIARRQ